MVSSKNLEADSNAANLNGGNKRSRVLSVARSTTSPSFQVKECVFHQMTEFIEIFIIVARQFSILFWRYNWSYARLLGQMNHSIRVITAICQKIIGMEPFYQFRCNCAIRCGTRSDKESHRHTMRIHSQMYLGVEPPFVRPIS